MEITINANRLIDALIALQDDVDQFYQGVPRGAYIADGSAYHRRYQTKEAANGKLNAINDATGIPMDVLDRGMRIARRWYKRTRWLRCLPDGDADRLLQHLVDCHIHHFKFDAGCYRSTGRKIKA